MLQQKALEDLAQRVVAIDLTSLEGNSHLCIN